MIKFGWNRPLSKKTKKRKLTKVELEVIKHADFTLQERCFVGLLHYAGLHRQEILALTKPYIDFFDDNIRVNKASKNSPAS